MYTEALNCIIDGDHVYDVYGNKVATSDELSLKNSLDVTNQLINLAYNSSNGNKTYDSDNGNKIDSYINYADNCEQLSSENGQGFRNSFLLLYVLLDYIDFLNKNSGNGNSENKSSENNVFNFDNSFSRGFKELQNLFDIKAEENGIRKKDVDFYFKSDTWDAKKWMENKKNSSGDFVPPYLSKIDFANYSIKDIKEYAEDYCLGEEDYRRLQKLNDYIEKINDLGKMKEALAVLIKYPRLLWKSSNELFAGLNDVLPESKENDEVAEKTVSSEEDKVVEKSGPGLKTVLGERRKDIAGFDNDGSNSNTGQVAEQSKGTQELPIDEQEVLYNNVLNKLKDLIKKMNELSNSEVPATSKKENSSNGSQNTIPPAPALNSEVPATGKKESSLNGGQNVSPLASVLNSGDYLLQVKNSLKKTEEKTVSNANVTGNGVLLTAFKKVRQDAEQTGQDTEQTGQDDDSSESWDDND